MQVVCERRVVATTALVLAAVLSIADVSRADSFTPGDLVVYRVGDESAPLANTGNPVFLDEYTTNGDFIQSIALPTVASGNNHPLIASGTAESEGMLTRSIDGQYLLLTGYSISPPSAMKLADTAAADVPRVVGRVGFDGKVDTSTVLTDFSDSNNPRCAVSIDGTGVWLAGASGGVRYTTIGSTSSVSLSSDSKNLQAISIFGGQLYASSQKGDLRVATVGSGLPTTAGQHIVNLPGFPTTGAPDGFFLADLDSTPGFDTLYVADDTTNDGEIQKYSLVDGSWTATGVITAAYVRGLAATVSGKTVTLYATSNGLKGISGTLYMYEDRSGYNGLVSGVATTIASALSSQGFRGVALAPEPGAVDPTPTPTTTPGGTCVGDCDGSGDVSVSDLIAMVNIALGSAPIDGCLAGDTNGDGTISVPEIVTAVGSALNGCTAG